MSNNVKFIVVCIVILNGIYDILCAYSLFDETSIVSDMKYFHLGMIRTDVVINEQNVKKQLINGLIINGCIRLFGGLSIYVFIKSGMWLSNVYKLIAFSYFFETFFVLANMEYLVLDKSIFVVVLSVLLGSLCWQLDIRN